MKHNYSTSHRLVACVLLTNLLLQSCYNPEQPEIYDIDQADYISGSFEHYENVAQNELAAYPHRPPVNFGPIHYEPLQAIPNAQQQQQETMHMQVNPGQDRRTRITATTEWPYSFHGQLKISYQDGNYGGSGVLVGPQHVLTAANNVYDYDKKKWAQQIVVRLGLNDNLVPYGEALAKRVYAFNGWVHQGDPTYNMALLVLDKPIGHNTGWCGLLAASDEDLRTHKVNITGYPGDKGLKQMWSMEDYLKEIHAEKLVHEIVTSAGQVGGGVWLNKWGSPYVVGVDTGKDPVSTIRNSGVRLSYAKAKQVLAWIGQTLSLKEDIQADIQQVSGIVNNEELQSRQWQLSVMDLSDHHKNKPSNTFLLLEQRNYAGDHIIHKLALIADSNNNSTSNLKLVKYSQAIHPNNLSTVLRKGIFGNMEYDFAKPTKPRYYGAHFTISQQKGDQLLLAYEQPHIVQANTDVYQYLHNLAVMYVTGGDKLNTDWVNYVQEPFVKMYKKDELLRIKAADMRRDSFLADLSAEQGRVQQQTEDNTQRLREHAEQFRLLDKVLEISGIKDDARIKEQLREYKNNKPALFAYCTTFIWTLKSYLDAYVIASSDFFATNEKSSTAEKGIKYVVDKSIEIGVGLIPIVGDFISILLGDTIDAIHEHLQDVKKANKIGAINQLLHQDHILPSQIEHSIAEAALEIAKRKEASIVTPPTKKIQSTLRCFASTISDKLEQLTNKLVNNHQLCECPQAELAVQDVVSLMTKLYEQYEELQASHTVELYKKMAELVCQGSLADMVISSISIPDMQTRIKNIQSKLTDCKLRERLKKKASKGLWDATPWFQGVRYFGKECEEYFRDEYIRRRLHKIQEERSQENIEATRIVLFQIMSEGIAEAIKNIMNNNSIVNKDDEKKKILKCAEEFGQKYPNVELLIELIARTHPHPEEYFKAKEIAACCIQDPTLLAKVIRQFP